jgi:HD superfamily phosphohydrolase
MISLISSQLDADRLDYLQRDAYNSGATYGEIDLDRIIRSILVVNNRIAFKYSGMHAIENYLMSRYHMYWQVYYHPVSISHEVLLVKIFSRVKDLLDEGYQFKNNIDLICKTLNNQLSIDEYLELDEVWINYHIKEWMKEPDLILRDLSKRLIHRNLFKHINCRSKQELDFVYEKLKMMFKKYKLDAKYYLHKDTLTKEAYQYYTDEVLHNSPILLLQRNDLVEIAEISHIVKGIKDIGAKKDYKVYFPKEMITRLDDTDLSDFNDLYLNQ